MNLKNLLDIKVLNKKNKRCENLNDKILIYYY